MSSQRRGEQDKSLKGGITHNNNNLIKGGNRTVGVVHSHGMFGGNRKPAEHNKDELDRLFEGLKEVRSNPMVLEDYFEALNLGVSESPCPHYVCPKSGRSILLHEGRRAVLEAQEFIKSVEVSQQMLSHIERDPLLDQLANAAAQELGQEGVVSHSPGGKALKQRIEEVGTWSGVLAENLCVLDADPASILATWIIDDGNTTRNQRKSIFLPE